MTIFQPLASGITAFLPGSKCASSSSVGWWETAMPSHGVAITVRREARSLAYSRPDARNPPPSEQTTRCSVESYQGTTFHRGRTKREAPEQPTRATQDFPLQEPL